MPGADNSLTLPAPKILEGNAVEIVEIDEWALSAIQHRDRHPQRFDQLPLVAALSGSAGFEQSASGYAIRSNEGRFSGQAKMPRQIPCARNARRPHPTLQQQV
jgi:hypothetical protein